MRNTSRNQSHQWLNTNQSTKAGSASLCLDSRSPAVLPVSTFSGGVEFSPSYILDRGSSPWEGTCCDQAIALKTLHPVPSDKGCIAQAVCAVVSILRHWRPSLWANRESSRITVAGFFACRIWITAKRRCSTASDRRHLAAS